MVVCAYGSYVFLFHGGSVLARRTVCTAFTWIYAPDSRNIPSGECRSGTRDMSFIVQTGRPSFAEEKGLPAHAVLVALVNAPDDCLGLCI